MDSTFQQTLIQAGLNGQQALIYELLLKNGPLKASKIANKSPFKRELVYRILDELITTGLVIKQEQQGKVSIFEPAHPNQLISYIDQQEQRAKLAKDATLGSLPLLVSQYNLSLDKPGVLFYEGREGIEAVLNDTLLSKEEILTYADLETIVKYIPDLNKAYVDKRNRLGVKKRGIVVDSPFARDYLKNYYLNVTETKLIKLEVPPFQTITQIYSGKVSYINLSPNRMIGVIIEDQQIYLTQKYLFEYLWQVAPSERIISSKLNQSST